METVSGWGTALLASTTAALTTLLAAVPRVIGFLVKRTHRQTMPRAWMHYLSCPAH